MHHDEGDRDRLGDVGKAPAQQSATSDVTGVRGSFGGGLVSWARGRNADHGDQGQSERFDTVARALASGQPRRRVLAGLAGSVAGVFGLANLRESEAFICRKPGVLCAKDAHCCSGLCDPDTHRCLEAPVGCQGPQGPQGPDCCGVQGCQGPQGPQGSQGPLF